MTENTSLKPITVKLPQNLISQANRAWRRNGYDSRAHLIREALARAIEGNYVPQ